MSRRERLDAAVVGGGVVGASCALALAGLGLRVALVEAGEPPHWLRESPDLRVYAFAPDNAALLDSLGVWVPVRDTCAQPYRAMRVWDAAGGEIVFDADTLGREQLGWIVENRLLADRLWAALPAAGVRVHVSARVQAMEQDEHGVRLSLDDGSRLDARLAIAADGAGSTLRRLAGLEVSSRDYGQRGVVAYVGTGLPHEQTAWQRFLPTGPLAFLPFTEGRSSIVWTLPDDEAERVVALEEADFCRELGNAFAGRLGEVRLLSKRAAFPLRLQLAERYVQGRVLLVGDAAHVVHPLAGQGVNLGLRDARALRDTVQAALSRRTPWDSPSRLQRWGRERRSHNTLAGYSFDGINKLFSNDEMHLSLLRGPLLGLAGKVPPLVSWFWRQAAGV